jgi:hypothetical protein
MKSIDYILASFSDVSLRAFDIPKLRGYFSYNKHNMQEYNFNYIFMNSKDLKRNAINIKGGTCEI